MSVSGKTVDIIKFTDICVGCDFVVNRGMSKARL